MRFFLIFVLALITALSNAQSENKDDLFSEGVYFFNREDYSEAVYYFKRLVELEPDNSHFNFRLGECFMNIRGSEEKAVPYFEKAIKSTVKKKKYHYGDAGELNAPLHAWFYLGNVYRIAGRLSEAMNAYDNFINSPYYYGNYNINVVENEIRSCEQASIIMGSPIEALIQPLDTLINTSASELFPVVTSDEKTMIFIRKLKFYDAILMVTREGDSWSTAVNLNPQIGSDGDFYPVSFSVDGNTLILVRNSGDNSDLYVSHKKKNVWSKAESLGKNVNSKADETWASISDDGQTLWFTSARKGGLGGLDIYSAKLDEKKGWGSVKNAGKLINTAFNEESPCIANSGNILYFSSRGHDSMGGYDIFYTILNGNTWQKPVNIGYPVNNTSDNTGYIAVSEGRAGYYSSVDMAAGSSRDIYRISFKNNPVP
jgi:Tol biopolymer transport system component